MNVSNIFLFIDGKPQPDDLPSLSLLVGLLFTMVVCLISALVAFLIWRKRKAQTERESSTQDETNSLNTQIINGKQLWYRECGLSRNYCFRIKC